MLVRRGQRVHPAVQRPRYAQVTQVQCDLCSGGKLRSAAVLDGVWDESLVIAEVDWQLVDDYSKR